ncbi:MAG: ABC transporter ATP-binding protein [Clostridia bacterium]|nr:ABC transporter ATP-binding protein [Clostridia bacterium]
MRTIRSFFSFYRPHLGLFILDMFCAFLVALIDVLFPYFTRRILYDYIPNEAIQSLIRIVILFGLGLVLRTICQWIVTYFGHFMGVKIEADMRNSIFSHMQTLSFSFFDHNRTGQLMSRITNDLFDITELAHHGPEDLFISFVTLIGAFIVLFQIQWTLALILLISVPIILLFIINRRKHMMRASKTVKQKTASINTEIETSLSGVRTAKAFCSEPYEIEKFRTCSEEYVKGKKSYYHVMAGFMSGTEFMLTLMSLLVISCGSALIMYKRMDLATLITFNMYVASIQTPIRKLTNFTEMFTQGMAGFLRYLEIMQVKPDIVDAPDAVHIENVKGDIVFDDVTFSYESDSPTVLSHINLNIPSGHMLAIVGPSGSGKTTLCQLIPRFYEIDGGRILLDGQDIRKIHLRDLRSSIGIVQQDVFLFAGTVLDNIRYGRMDATPEEVVAAAKLAEIHDDIMTWPEGYNTEVGERGVMLSGGQKQRISSARVFLCNPKVLILDEATSALDTTTERKIQSAFAKLYQGRTTLVIAHRLSTIKNADEIVVIDEKGIHERGTHDELIQQNGIYAQLLASSEE